VQSHLHSKDHPPNSRWPSRVFQQTYGVLSSHGLSSKESPRPHPTTPPPPPPIRHPVSLLTFLTRSLAKWDNERLSHTEPPSPKLPLKPPTHDAAAFTSRNGTKPLTPPRDHYLQPHPFFSVKLRRAPTSQHFFFLFPPPPPSFFCRDDR